jgi:protocatechuate 3,4-dioxygenase beta subunit
MITNTAFFRRDIGEGRPGLPVTLVLTIVNTASSCTAVTNAAVEIWQCDAAGNYSEYAQPGYDGTGQTFLRGLQATDAGGQVTFNTVYPGWYAGRATHIHVEVFVNGTSIKTTQIAFPEDVSAQVYATGVYAAKGQNPTHNTSDNVFSDGTTNEMATLTGSATAGYTATLTIGVTV